MSKKVAIINTLLSPAVWQWIVQKIARYVTLQLFLTLISLPILIWWGIPLSLLSPAGNIIFTPFLIVFLFLSSLLFFTELLHIPNSLIAQLLNQWTNSWVTLLHNLWPWPATIACIKPTHYWLLAIIPFIACAIITRKSLSSGAKATLLMLTLVICSLALKPHATLFYELNINKKPVQIMVVNHSVWVIDHGGIGRSSSARSWTQYTLMQELRKKAGHTMIDYFVATKPTIFLFDALIGLCEQKEVNTIFMPQWRGTISSSAWKKYKELLSTAQKQGITIRLIQKNETIKGNDQKPINLTLSSKQYQYHNATYHKLIATRVDNPHPPFYDAQEPLHD